MAAWLNFIVSLILPLWGIAVIYLGLHWFVMSWLGCGIGVSLMGLILMAGNPWVTGLLRRP
jgi:hypothetical protein